MQIKTALRKLFVEELHYKLPALKTFNDSEKFNIASQEMPLGIVWTNSDNILDAEEEATVFGACGFNRYVIETDVLLEFYLPCCQASEEQVDLISVEVMKLITSITFQEKLSELGVTQIEWTGSDIARNTDGETPMTLKTYEFTVRYDFDTLINGSL